MPRPAVHGRRHKAGGLNVVDIEATYWEGQPPPGAVSEIIEIGLTPAEVAGGVGFAEACRILADAHDARSRPWASWGDYDRKQFERQCRAAGAPYPAGRPAEQGHTNAKAVFTEAYGLRKRPGMAGALQLAGLPLEGRHHRGEDDAWNIAALVLDPVERGLWTA
ncbi:DNA polymerase III [Streptomyces sp. NPDC002463]|uniref:DNA polymerase III n=1 Tax=Streptomyces sp. NPDC002463 TaxID=3364645 RepID=UPI0036A465F6